MRKIALVGLCLFLFGCGQAVLEEEVDNSSVVEEEASEVVAPVVVETESILKFMAQGEDAQTPWVETSLNSNYLVEVDVRMTDANDQMFDEGPTPYLVLKFNEEGAHILAEVTEGNLGKSLAIFYGDELLSAPFVQDVIRGGEVQIAGNMTYEEMSNFAKILRASIYHDSEKF